MHRFNQTRAPQDDDRKTSTLREHHGHLRDEKAQAKAKPHPATSVLRKLPLTDFLQPHRRPPLTHLQQPASPAPQKAPVKELAPDLLAAAERSPWALAAPGGVRHWPDGGDFLDVALNAVRPEEREGYIERPKAFVEQHRARLEEMLRTHGPGRRNAEQQQNDRRTEAEAVLSEATSLDGDQVTMLLNDAQLLKRGRVGSAGSRIGPGAVPRGEGTGADGSITLAGSPMGAV
ncbi:hypothetical protein [Streptomyces syringium]|uniref:hypothetical protein n=1 Tax=Streptomyces syringium TaxID=76729 RepID=UPI003405FD2C